MTKIYVVTEGWYEDSTVYGVFSTRELADDFIVDDKELRDLASVEEWLLDGTDKCEIV